MFLRKREFNSALYRRPNPYSIRFRSSRLDHQPACPNQRVSSTQDHLP